MDIRNLTLKFFFWFCILCMCMYEVCGGPLLHVHAHEHQALLVHFIARQRTYTRTCTGTRVSRISLVYLYWHCTRVSLISLVYSTCVCLPVSMILDCLWVSPFSSAIVTLNLYHHWSNWIQHACISHLIGPIEYSTRVSLVSLVEITLGDLHRANRVSSIARAKSVRYHCAIDIAREEGTR